MTSRRAVFLDRDGVINVDRGYVHRIDHFEFLPGIFDLARFVAHTLRRPIIVATNQSGIGRGYFDEAQHAALTDWMCERFRAEGAPIEKVYHCPFHPEFGLGRYRFDHEWRKPKPGMFLAAAADFALDLAGCTAIGDRMSDVEAAAAAGIAHRIRLVPDGSGTPPPGPAHDVVSSLDEALSLLRGCAAANVRSD